MTDAAMEKAKHQWTLKKHVAKEDKDMILSLHNLKEELDAAYNAFDFTTDELLVDSLVYKIQYLQKKYEYYNKKAKELLMEEAEKIS